jgi:hypothetical protein
VLIYAYPVLVIPMHRELGWPYSQLSTAYATALAVCGAAGVPVGWWLQRHGPRLLMTAGSALTGLALALWSAVRSIQEFYAVCAVAGLAMAMTLYEPALATTAVWFREHRARAVAVITAVAGLAVVVFAPFTAWLAGTLGWRPGLLVLAVVAACVGMPVHGLVLRRGQAGPGTAVPGPCGATGGQPAIPEGSGRLPFHRRRSFAWLAACLTLSALAKSAIVIGLATYLVGRGYPLPEAALAAGGIGIAQVAGRLIMVALSRRWAEQHVAATMLTAAALAAGPLLLTAGHGRMATATVIAFVAVFGNGCGLVEVLRGTLLPEFYGVDAYPRVNGLMSVFVVAARAVAPLAIGAAFLVARTLTPVLVITAVAVGVSTMALLLADHAYRAEEAAPRLR